MCCHKTCSWQRLNVRWDSAAHWALGIALPTVLVHVSFPWRLCTVRITQTWHFQLLHSVSIHCSPSGGKNQETAGASVHKNVLRCHLKILGQWRDVGSFGSALPQIYISDENKTSGCHLIYSAARRQTKPRVTLRNSLHTAMRLTPSPFNVQSWGFHNLL